MAKDGVAGEGSARILVNSGFRAIADIGGKLATAALFIVLARTVGAADYGVWTFAFSFAILLTIPGSIGQDIVLTREVARDHDRLDDYFADAMVSRVVLTFPVLVIALITASVADMSAETRLVVLLLGLGCILDGLLHLVFAVFQAFERLGAVPVILMTQRWGTTLGALLALALGQGVAVVAGIYAACAAVALVLGLVLITRLLVRPRFRFSRWAWARLMRQAVPIGIASVAFYVLLRIDTAMLALFQPAADVGMYGAAYRLLETTMFVSWSVNAAVLPVLSRLSPTSEPSVGFVYGRALKLVLALTLPVAVGAFVLADPLIETCCTAPSTRLRRPRSGCWCRRSCCIRSACSRAACCTPRAGRRSSPTPTSASSRRTSRSTSCSCRRTPSAAPRSARPSPRSWSPASSWSRRRGCTADCRTRGSSSAPRSGPRSRPPSCTRVGTCWRSRSCSGPLPTSASC